MPFFANVHRLGQTSRVLKKFSLINIRTWRSHTTSSD